MEHLVVFLLFVLVSSLLAAAAVVTPGSSSSGSAATGTYSVNFPTCAVGDMLIMTVALNINLNPTTPTNWTAMGTSIGSTTVLQKSTYYHLVAPGESAATTVSIVPGAHASVTLIQNYGNLQQQRQGGIPGAIASIATGLTNVATASGTTVNAPSLAVSDRVRNTMFANYAQLATSTYSGPPAGWAIDSQVTAQGMSLAIMSKNLTGLQTPATGTLTLTTTGTGVGVGTSWYSSPLFLDMLDQPPGI